MDRGPALASELETQALDLFAEDQRLVLLVNHHPEPSRCSMGPSWQGGDAHRRMSTRLYQAMVGYDADPAETGSKIDVIGESSTSSTATSILPHRRVLVRHVVGSRKDVDRASRCSTRSRRPAGVGDDWRKLIQLPRRRGPDQAQFEKNILFASPSPKSAVDPTIRSPVVGIDTPSFVVDLFVRPQRRPRQTAAVTAKRDPRPPPMNHRGQRGRYPLGVRLRSGR